MSLTRGKYANVIATAECFARELRKHQTRCEEVLWEALRTEKVFGLKFYRQQPIYVDKDGRESFYIPDFFCKRRNLVLEVDGPIHRQRSEYDDLRSVILESYGVTVYRIQNHEIEEDVTAVIMKLKDFLRKISPDSQTQHEDCINNEMIRDK